MVFVRKGGDDVINAQQTLPKGRMTCNTCILHREVTLMLLPASCRYAQGAAYASMRMQSRTFYIRTASSKWTAVMLLDGHHFVAWHQVVFG